jgi:hypothetical protein
MKRIKFNMGYGRNQSSDEIHVSDKANTAFNPLKKKGGFKILKKPFIYCSGILSCLLVLTMFMSVGCEKLNGPNVAIPTISMTYYIVGYDACSIGNISNDSGEYKTGGYLFISEDLADTLVAHNLPNGIFDFPEEIMDRGVLGFNFFPQEYRFSYPVQIIYRTATEEEIQNLVKPCIIYYLQVYDIDPTYIIIMSISKIQ